MSYNIKKLNINKIAVLLATFFVGFSCFAAPNDYNAIEDAPNLKNAFTAEQAGDEPLIDTVANISGYDVSKSEVEPIIGTVIQTALSLLGIIFVILMIYGGYLWMTAKGNEEQVTKAKNVIIAAITGLVIVISAYAISYFVISKISAGVLKTS